MNNSSNDIHQKQLVLVGPVLEKKINEKILATLHLTDVPQIAIDGGIHFASKPILWMGDQDSGSLSDSTVPALKKHTQDETDLHFCLAHIQPWTWSELHLFGFLGKRKDHELANLGEVYSTIKSRTQMKKAIFYSQSFTPQVFIFPAGKHSVSLQGLFSVLTFEQAVISLSGQCQFQVNQVLFPAFSGRGISNQGDGEVQIQSASPFIVFI